MTHGRLFFVDIETVPDREVLPADFAEDAFPAKPIQHRIVAISFLAAALIREGGREQYVVEECRSGGELASTEEQLLAGFWRRFERDKPRVVTWNGRGFDLPVLVQRAFVYGIPANYWHQGGDRSGYRYRYAVESHCDLMDALADHGASKALKLEEAAVALGLPGKIGGHGSEVRDMVAAGKLAEVRAYCESDVLNLFVLYVRWAFITGRIDALSHNAALDSLVAYLERERAERPHLGTFIDAWCSSTRPAPMHVLVPLRDRVVVTGESEHLRSEDVLTQGTTS
jgi:predicted PolB exonuclease-like 3'-5' exonuclease